MTKPRFCISFRFLPAGSAAVCLVLALLATAPGPLRAQQGEKLNFIVFLADDLGYMDVGFNHPGTFYETPRLDRLDFGVPNWPRT